MDRKERRENQGLERIWFQEDRVSVDLHDRLIWSERQGSRDYYVRRERFSWLHSIFFASYIHLVVTVDRWHG